MLTVVLNLNMCDGMDIVKEASIPVSPSPDISPVLYWASSEGNNDADAVMPSDSSVNLKSKKTLVEK